MFYFLRKRTYFKAQQPKPFRIPLVKLNGKIGIAYKIIIFKENDYFICGYKTLYFLIRNIKFYVTKYKYETNG